jgi:hypothetical protein
LDPDPSSFNLDPDPSCFNLDPDSSCFNLDPDPSSFNLGLGTYGALPSKILVGLIECNICCLKEKTQLICHSLLFERIPAHRLVCMACVLCSS